MISEQSVQPQLIEIVDDPPIINTPDVTWRYRIGIERLREKGADVIVCWEDDDWYSWKYIDRVVGAWQHSGEPDIFGIQQTIYYNIPLGKYAILRHPGRSSMMSMVINPDAKIEYCEDTNQYLDYHIWVHNAKLSRVIFLSKEIINVGIKHNIGMVAGGGHTYKNYYVHDDIEYKYLRSIIDKDSFDFYINIING